MSGQSRGMTLLVGLNVSYHVVLSEPTITGDRIPRLRTQSDAIRVCGGFMPSNSEQGRFVVAIAEPDTTSAEPGN